MIALGRWAARAPAPPPDAPIGADSLVLALRGLFDPAAANGLRATYELRLGADRFRIEVADAAIEVARGEVAQPDAIIASDPGTLDNVLWRGGSLDDALRSGKLAVEGDKAAVERFFALFPLPSRPTPAYPVSCVLSSLIQILWPHGERHSPLGM